MKKLYTLLMMAMMAAATCTMTSCDEDIDIANSLEGTWSGTMFVYTDYRDSRYYATSTEITFEGDPFRWTRGTGYWIDHYSGAPWDYVANHIDWRVNNRDIEIYFREDHTTMVICDYRLSDNYFTGYICATSTRPTGTATTAGATTDGTATVHARPAQPLLTAPPPSPTPTVPYAT